MLLWSTAWQPQPLHSYVRDREVHDERVPMGCRAADARVSMAT
jgi:hypothetical protein